MTGKLIRLDQIVFPPEYEREPDAKFDERLEDSVEKSGVQQSIIVFQRADGRYDLCKGGSRIQRAEGLGHTTIPAVIYKYPPGVDEKKHRDQLRFELTELRQDLLPSQRANLIKQLMDKYGLGQKDVPAVLRMKVNEGTISLWLAILDYHPEIVDLIDRNVITLHSAKAFEGMKRDMQPRVYRQFKREFQTMSGDKLFKLVRSKFSPKKTPAFYDDPETAIRKLEVKKRGRRKPKRVYSRDEKAELINDVELKEVELRDSKAELEQMKKELRLWAIPARAVMRSDELRLMMPPGVEAELERYLEVY